MKKFISIVIVTLLVLGLTACGTKYKEGVYEGEAKGFSPDQNIKVGVTISEDGKISDVTIVSHSETDEIGGVALEKMKKQVIEKGTIDIDSVAAATVTSEAFKEAVKQALEQAK